MVTSSQNQKQHMVLMNRKSQTKNILFSVDDMTKDFIDNNGNLDHLLDSVIGKSSDFEILS